MSLQGKHIFITGGGRGIGRSIALSCKKNGASVTVVARTLADLDETRIELDRIPGGKALAIKCDVTQRKELIEALKTSTHQMGPVYGLIAAAGVYGSIGAFVDCDFNEWERGLDINLKGTALTVHTAYPFMKDSSGGRIILFSGGGQGPLDNFTCYVTSKGGIWRFTETLGAELAPRGIFVNAIAPGAVNTKFLDDLLQAGPEKVGKTFYEKSLAQRESGGQSPEKAADLCQYLLSEKSKGLWGKTLSAVWDPYKDFSNLESMSKGDIYSYRRVVDDKGNTRSK